MIGKKQGRKEIGLISRTGKFYLTRVKRKLMKEGRMEGTKKEEEKCWRRNT